MCIVYICVLVMPFVLVVCALLAATTVDAGMMPGSSYYAAPSSYQQSYTTSTYAAPSYQVTQMFLHLFCLSVYFNPPFLFTLEI